MPTLYDKRRDQTFREFLVDYEKLVANQHKDPGYLASRPLRQLSRLDRFSLQPGDRVQLWFEERKPHQDIMELDFVVLRRLGGRGRYVGRVDNPYFDGTVLFDARHVVKKLGPRPPDWTLGVPDGWAPILIALAGLTAIGIGALLHYLKDQAATAAPALPAAAPPEATTPLLPVTTPTTEPSAP